MEFHNYIPMFPEFKYDRPSYKDTSAETLQKKHEYPNVFDAEVMWWDFQRPYYNAFPSIVKMLLEVDLDIPCSALAYPFPSILVRVPKNCEHITRVRSVLSMIGTRENDGLYGLPEESKIERMIDLVVVFTAPHGEVMGTSAGFLCDGKQLVNSVWEESIHDVPARGGMTLDETVRVMRDSMCIAVGVSILASDHQFVQPIVLNRDKLKYANADDATKAYLENRAARLQGRGHMVGEQLEKDLAAEAHDVSAHIRRPHMALFWTGKGRETPRLQLRRGCLVKPHDITKVPTGFLDNEDASYASESSVSVTKD